MTATSAGPTTDRRTAAERIPWTKLAEGYYAVLPGLLIVYFGFNGGGFFAEAPAFAALILTVALVVRVCVARDPAGGATRGLLVVGALLAAFAGWVLLSQLWTDSSARPLIEFDRVWMYMLILVTIGVVPRSRNSAALAVRSLAVGAFVVAGSGLITRLLPEVWPTDPGRIEARLSYPVAYWNTLGLVAAIGALLGLGLTACDRESRWARIAAAGSLPVFATTLYLTFSRGAIAAVVIGLLVYLVVSQQRVLIGALVAVVPPTAFGTVTAYRADALAASDPTTAAAVDQGGDVAVVIALCMVAAAALRWLVAPLDRRMLAFPSSARVRRGLASAAAAITVVALLIALSMGAAGWAERQVDRFGAGSEAIGSNVDDARRRLTDPSNNGRTEYWDVALSGFAEARVAGHGAGTYQFEWEERRSRGLQAIDAHSLYLETLAELGVVGLILLGGALLGVVIALWIRMRGPNRGFYAALFAAGVAWLVRAGVDWDWEMPVATVFFFVAGGVALAGRRRSRKSAVTTPALPRRVLLGVGLLAAAVLPALLMVSQGHLNRAATAFEQRDCERTRDSALSSIRAMSTRPEPYQMLAYCNIESVAGKAAVEAMEKAVALEPASWEYRYSLALARATNGQDPRAAVSDAAQRAPLEPMVTNARAAFATADSPRAWKAAARPLVADTLRRQRLTLR